MTASAARLTIDLNALAANYATLVREANGAEVAPVVKADGYGLGAIPVARRLIAEGAKTFFVARVAEGPPLRAALGPDPTIHVLDGCPVGAEPILRAAQLTPVLNTLDQIERWRASGGGAAALMLDTGLNRLGLSDADAHALAADPARLQGIELGFVMSHLACADDAADPMNHAQRVRFEALAALFPTARRSLAASDGLFLGRDYTFQMVRTGICLYGGGPHGAPDPRIQAVATFEAPILQVRNLAAGDVIGYGATFTASKPMQVAVVAAGYADGVLRSSSSAAYGWLDGQRCAVLGRISMDLTIYDVTDQPGAAPGQMMQIIGKDVPVDDAARAAGTIAYELLTRLGARAERRYVGRGA